MASLGKPQRVTAAAAVAVGVFLPWVSVFGYSKSGVEGDGILTLILAAVGLLLIWRARFGWVGQGALAALVVLVALYDLNDAGNLAAIGLYVTFLGGITWIVGVFMARAATKPSTALVRGI
jgi:hypothetical protein